MKAYKLLNLTGIGAATVMSLGLASNSALALELNIYGVGHLSVDSNDNGTTSQMYVASNSSRLGFKGNQNVSSALKLIFQFESGVDLTGEGTNDGNGAGTTNNLFSTARDSYAGLSGNFGTVMAGKFGGLNQWVYDYNLFADQIGDLGNIWGGTGLPGRVNSTIAYTTPDMNGLDALIAYRPENGTADGDIPIIKFNYKTGNLKFGLGYMSVGKGTGNPEHGVTAFTGSYNAGDWSVGGGFQSESDIGGTAGNDRDSYTIGASFKVGDNGNFKAQYTASDADAANADATQMAIGYDYNLDKATTVYVAYSSTDNDPNATFTANNYGHGKAVTPASGQDPASISIGVVYKFDVGLVK